MGRSYWSWGHYYVKSSGVKHKATQKKELLYNKCPNPKCGIVDKGIVVRWPKTKYWYWRCPQCWTTRRYPK